MMVNQAGNGYEWIASTSAGVDQYRTFEEIRDTAAGLSSTTTDPFFTITYVDNGDSTSYLDYDIATDLSLYDNTTSKFFSTTTDTLGIAYGGTGATDAVSSAPPRRCRRARCPAPMHPP